MDSTGLGHGNMEYAVTVIVTLYCFDFVREWMSISNACF